MKKFTTSDRLKQIMSEREMKQVDILEACKPYCQRFGVKLAKNDLSQYISGKVQPGQDKLTILGMALNVNEVWLMGYNVPADKDGLDVMERRLKNESSNCELFEECYGKEAYKAVALFLKLDEIDRAVVAERMKTLLESDKYSVQEGLKSG